MVVVVDLHELEQWPVRADSDSYGKCRKIFGITQIRHSRLSLSASPVTDQNTPPRSLQGTQLNVARWGVSRWFQSLPVWGIWDFGRLSSEVTSQKPRFRHGFRDSIFQYSTSDISVLILLATCRWIQTPQSRRLGAVFTHPADFRRPRTLAIVFNPLKDQ